MKSSATIAQNERNSEILKLYRGGKTLAEIANIFGFTRSRAQQIIIKEIKKEIKNEFNLQYLSQEEEKSLCVAASEEMKDIFTKKRMTDKTEAERLTIEKIRTKMLSIPDHSVFFTLSDYAKALGEKTEQIKKYFPEISNEIIKKQRKKWSRYYNKCRSCGTTAIKHVSYGLCENCYFKSAIFKEYQEASRLRNKHKWKERELAYAKAYQDRPEVKERVRKANDIKNFDGNREKALKRDNYTCQRCGITHEQSLAKLKKDLFVKHLQNKKDNSLDNLITLCTKCFSKETVKLMHKGFKNKFNKK